MLKALLKTEFKAREHLGDVKNMSSVSKMSAYRVNSRSRVEKLYCIFFNSMQNSYCNHQAD